MASGTVVEPLMLATPVAARGVPAGGSMAVPVGVTKVRELALIGTPVITAVTRPSALTTRS